MKKIVMMLVGVGMALNSAVAAPAVSDISARQRYPWNGLVDLKFTVTGTSGTKYDASFTAKDMVGNTNVVMKTIRKSDGTTAAAKESLLPGTYSWIWDAAADLPDGFKCGQMSIMVDISEFSYTVNFNANGGTGSMANQSFTYGAAKALTANAFTRTGYTFQGWATSANGGKVYSNKQSVSNLATTSGAVVNLYAVWEHNKLQLWADGPYWATVNIGAEKPEDCGYYFWWGDTVGYKYKNDKWVATDGSSSNYSFKNSNTPTYNKDISTLRKEGWITSNNVLAPEHDAAHVKWGGNWRMPTEQEFEDLKSKCDWTQIWLDENYLRKYYVVRGRGAYASNSIILPFGGFGRDNYRSGFETAGHYWSSTIDPDRAYFAMQLEATYRRAIRGDVYFGYPIRPVQSATK